MEHPNERTRERPQREEEIGSKYAKEYSLKRTRPDARVYSVLGSVGQRESLEELGSASARRMDKRLNRASQNETQ